jgi:YHS domain-containing protein
MRNLSLMAILFLSAVVHAADAPPSQPYPLATCVVSGDKLAAMGTPVIINYHGTEVRFCCHDCVASFHENPEKYLAKLKATASKP